MRDPRTLLDGSGQPDGFTAFLEALREEPVAFARPVVLVDCDGTTSESTNPQAAAGCAGQAAGEVTRLETPGDNAANGNNDVHWTKVLVDPNSREVFSFQPQTVPANRVAVPAP